MGRPLDILMVAARALPFTGGIETHIHEVGPRMVARGHRVTVLTADPTGRLPPREEVAGMTVVRVAASPRAGDTCFAPDLYRRVATGGDWDLVHVQGYHTFSAPFAMLGAIRARIPFVLTFHSGGHSSPVRTAIRGLHQRLLGPLVGRAAALIGVSEFERDHFSRTMRIPLEGFGIVPNGAALPAAVPHRPSADGTDGPLIVSLGRLERYKGHHRAIEAFAQLLATHPTARLRILGEGPYEAQLRALASRRGLADRVAIGGIPARDRAEMAGLLGQAAVVVLLSDYEAHPVAVMEALSLGRPVVTSDTSGFRELAAQGLVRALPLDAPARTIADAWVEAMGAGSETTRIALPDWNDCAERLLSIYQSVAVRTGPARDRPGVGVGVGDLIEARATP